MCVYNKRSSVFFLARKWIIGFRKHTHSRLEIEVCEKFFAGKNAFVAERYARPRDRHTHQKTSIAREMVYFMF
jgi:hypothetical protein